LRHFYVEPILLFLDETPNTKTPKSWSWTKKFIFFTGKHENWHLGGLTPSISSAQNAQTGWTDSQMNRQMNRQSDEQTDREIYIERKTDRW